MGPSYFTNGLLLMLLCVVYCLQLSQERLLVRIGITNMLLDLWEPGMCRQFDSCCNISMKPVQKYLFFFLGLVYLMTGIAHPFEDYFHRD